MKTPEDVIDRLGRLSAADRAWILRALSGGAKARLQRLTAALHGRYANSPRPEPAPSPPLDLEQLAPRLTAEPAWVLALVLSLRPGPWQAQLLARLAPDKRLEVAQLRASLPHVSPKMEEALARALSERNSAAADAPDGSFEDAFKRARVGVRRRRRIAGVGA